MHLEELTSEYIKGISISRKNERTFTCSISIDVARREDGVYGYTTGLMYAKALLSGCDGYTRDAFLTEINLIGATLSVAISNGLLTISFTSLDTNAHKLLKLVHAMLAKPTFAQTELKRIKELLRSELHEEKEDAKTLSVYAFVNTLYKERNRRYTPGSDDVIPELEKISRKEVVAFHARVFKAQWIYTLVANPVLEEEVKKAIVLWRGTSKIYTETSNTNGLKVQKVRTVKLVSVPSKQNIEFSIGGSLPLCLTQKEYYAFLFGLQVLGKWGGFVGRLMSTVREKEGLTYGIYARTETVTKNEYGYWRIMTFFAPSKALQGITSTLREVKLIRDKGITKEEFERFKTILGTSQTLLQDSILRVANEIHAFQVKGLSLEEIKTHKKALLSVTREEVNKALKTYLDDSLLVIAGAGPIASVSKEIKALGGIAKKEE